MKKHWTITQLIFHDEYKAFRFRTAFILYGLIIVVGMVPGARAEVGEFASGLSLHTIAYSIITFLLFTGSEGRPAGKALRVWIMVAAMGALDEFVQSFVPYRSGTVQDWIVDVTAGFATVFLLWIFIPRKAATHPRPNENK